MPLLPRSCGELNCRIEWVEVVESGAKKKWKLERTKNTLRATPYFQAGLVQELLRNVGESITHLGLSFVSRQLLYKIPRSAPGTNSLLGLSPEPDAPTMISAGQIHICSKLYPSYWKRSVKTVGI
jgi:hypothetical protein